MAILIDEKKRVLVQGITGREGRARTRLMREYGTNVVAGVTPGKGGQTVLGVPVFNTPQEAVNSLGNIDISVLFVPAIGVKDAAISAIDAGIKLSVLVPDRVPVWDAMEIAAAAKANGAMFLGPNTLGALSPGKAVVGMIGGRAESARQWFKPESELSAAPAAWLQALGIIWAKRACGFQRSCTLVAMRCLAFEFPTPR